MAFVTIEDKTGEIELIVFPNVYEASSHILTKGTAICLRGEISAEEGKPPKILASGINLISEGLPEPGAQRKRTQSAPLPSTPPPAERERVQSYVPKEQKSQTLYLKLPSKESEVFEKVMSIISIFEGRTPVIIYNEKEKKYEKYRSGVDIRPNMLAYLKKLLGEECVVLK